MRAGGLVGDIGARVTDPDDEDRTVLQLGGSRYSLECSWRIAGSSSPANSGTCGRLNAPVATITCSASKRRSPAVTTYPPFGPSARRTESARMPLTTGSANFAAYASR
jgi:hypothetical protein